MLPWSIAFTLAIVYVVSLVATQTVVSLDGVEVQTSFYLAFWYLLTFLPPTILGLLYASRAGYGRARAVAFAHIQVLYGYVNLLAAWRGVARIRAGRAGWAKTRRVAEETA